MLKFKNTSLFLIFFPFLFLSCWGDSSPTSDKSKTFKISGVVADKNGAGIGGVTVRITGTIFSSTDTTNAEGVFSFEGLKSGDYNIKAHKDSCFFKPANLDISVAKADIDTLKFTSADNYIHGRLLDIMTDKAAHDVTVVIQLQGSSYKDSTKTDINGEYYFFDKDKGNYNYYFLTGNVIGIWFISNYTIESKAFSDSEIIIPDHYVSLEILKITSAKFSEDTKTLTIEWTQSKSDDAIGYTLFRKGVSFANKDIRYGSQIEHYKSNIATIKITPEYVKGLFNEDIISGIMYFAVSAVYSKGNDYSINNAPLSDEVGLRLSW